MLNVTPHAPHSRSRAPLDPETEFVMLVALRERTNARLDELTGQLWSVYGLPPSPLQRLQAEDAPETPVVTLPRSGLSQSRPGVLLFKGGRDA